MRILHTIEQDHKLRAGYDIVVFGIAVRGAQCNNSLMYRAIRDPVERLTRLEPDGDVAFAAEVDDLLHARSARASGHEHSINGSACRHGFFHRMNSDQYAH